VWSDLRAFLDEPEPVRPRDVPVIDVVCAGLVCGAAAFEWSVRAGVLPIGDAVAGALVAAAAILLRRPRPLLAAGVGFGVAALSGLVNAWRGVPPIDLHAAVGVLLVPYSLARWASGRGVVAGLGVIASAYGVSWARGEMSDPGESLGAALVLAFPMALGLASRFRAQSHQRELESQRLRERTKLARELHDTVAHHVTAIAIQAQAAKALLASRPELAAAALGAIEGESKRTLSELRSLVGALRDDEGAALTPQGGIAELGRFSSDAGVPVQVDVSGAVDEVGPSVSAAVFRIVQESVTNARRHARGAAKVSVRVTVANDDVTVEVEDDGRSTEARNGAGFGLIGMSERAALLGGSFDAGPAAGGGWRVRATLPRLERDR